LVKFHQWSSSYIGIWGVLLERCHRVKVEHFNWHRSNPLDHSSEQNRIYFLCPPCMHCVKRTEVSISQGLRKTSRREREVEDLNTEVNERKLNAQFQPQQWGFFALLQNTPQLSDPAIQLVVTVSQHIPRSHPREPW